MSLHQKDWLKLVGAAALAMTGAGLAGVGPMAAMLGGSAGATGAGAAGALGAGAAGGLGATAATTGALGSASPMIGGLLASQGVGLGMNAVTPQYGMSSVGAIPSEQQPKEMDFHQLVQQSQRNNKLQLRDPFAPR